MKADLQQDGPDHTKKQHKACHGGGLIFNDKSVFRSARDAEITLRLA